MPYQKCSECRNNLNSEHLCNAKCIAHNNKLRLRELRDRSRNSKTQKEVVENREC